MGIDERRARGVLKKALDAAQATPLQRRMAAILLDINGLDNALAFVGGMNAAAGALGFNDSRVDQLVVTRGAVDKDNPRAEVSIEVLRAVAAGEEGTT